MMELVAPLAIGLLIGGILGWLWAKGQFSPRIAAARQSEGQLREDIGSLKSELTAGRQDLILANQQLAYAQADNRAFQERLNTQKQGIEALNQKFSIEFENIANKVLDTKTEKFTQLNKTNLEAILQPLGKNINEFKEQVTRAYQDESKERFSLGEKVKELAQLNLQLSEDAKNLTRALKGEAKTQGRWGEMILENILAKSGLRKGEEYFMEYQLYDGAGNPLRSEAKGGKMRPDAVVKYPDDRHVIIDSKVSINAFLRYIEGTDPEEQKSELRAHVQAIKGHILELSEKAYDDYDKTLDFVMMFVPSEAAFIAALQGEPDLWDFAYDRRILLISPTNLITALKLIVDLWKREYQNRNAQAIADRGAKLYDKFCGFIKNMQDVGIALDASQAKYRDAFSQLTSGRDNLVLQATKLKHLGIKTKSEIPSPLVLDAQAEDQKDKPAD